MTPQQFVDKFNACEEGRLHALKYETMVEVWDNCPNPRWLLWMMQKLGIYQLDPAVFVERFEISAHTAASAAASAAAPGYRYDAYIVAYNAASAIAVVEFRNLTANPFK